MSQAAEPARPENPNPFQRIAGVFVSPMETLRAISNQPDWIVPLILILLISIVATVLVAPRMDIASGMRAQFEKQGLSEEQQEKALELAEKIGRFTPTITAVSTPVVMLAIAGLFMLAFRVFGGEGSFPQYFSLTLYSWLPQLLKSVILTGVMMFREKVPVEEMPTLVKSNLAFLAGQPLDNPVLFALLAALDIFTFWTLFLMVVGYAEASRMRRGQSAGIVIGIWLVVTIFRVAMAALQGAAA